MSAGFLNILFLRLVAAQVKHPLVPSLAGRVAPPAPSPSGVYRGEWWCLGVNENDVSCLQLVGFRGKLTERCRVYIPFVPARTPDPVQVSGKKEGRGDRISFPSTSHCRLPHHQNNCFLRDTAFFPFFSFSSQVTFGSCHPCA